jgi:hypothetical protein
MVNTNKYTFLKNVKPEFLNIIIEDMFENGYNTYVKSFVRNDINSSENNIIVNNITENKQSSQKGQVAENVVYDILVDKFPDYVVENMAKIPHSGDIHITMQNQNKLIVEIKNYNKTIDQSEIDKLKFDMKFNNIYYAVFISLNSGIVAKKRFQFESFYYNKHFYYIIYVPYAMHKVVPTKKNIIVHNSLEESITNLSTKLEYVVSIMNSLSISIIKPTYNKYLQTDNHDFVIAEFNKFYDEFTSLRNSAFKLEENIKKSLESHMIVIKDYEQSIKNNINKLISSKILTRETTYCNNYRITEYTNNVWDILVNNITYGKIVKINEKYDLLLTYQNITHHENFDCFQECNNLLKVLFD